MNSKDKLYCTNCKTTTNHNPKLSAIMGGCMVCDECSIMNGFCSLIKVGDDEFKKSSKNIKWVEFEKGLGKTMHDKVEIGYSLIMSPFNDGFTWLTSAVTEIIEETDNFIHFKTNNSEYKLYNNFELSKKYD